MSYLLWQQELHYTSLSSKHKIETQLETKKQIIH